MAKARGGKPGGRDSGGEGHFPPPLAATLPPAPPSSLHSSSFPSSPSPPPPPPPERGGNKGKGNKGKGKDKSPAAKKGARGKGGLLLRLLVLGLIWGGMAGLALLAYFTYDLPDVRHVAQHVRRPAVTLLTADGMRFSRTGELQGEIYDVQQLPPHLVHAVLAIEDRRFYRHFGIDPIGLARAVWVNMRSDRAVQGGSTITQQLAKNLFLTTQRTLRRKVQEALLALWLEQLYTKDQILTAYLNRVYLGAGTYGVDAAAQTYFGKKATAVSLQEAALIAGLLKAPSHYSPLVNPTASLKRGDVVLGAMADGGFISATEAELARLMPPALQTRANGGEARYFADWVSDQVGSYIGTDHEDVQVITTLDLSIQQSAEIRLAALLDKEGPVAHVGQGAVVVMAPDGAVRALVGGRRYGESQFNRATQAHRQPGSAFKPFVFLAALGSGYTPDTTVEDSPLRIGDWSPANFEKGFRGAISLRDALAHSVNTAAVRLLDRVGVDKVRRLALKLGITSPLGRDLSLALGTSEVTPLELTTAYAGLASGGRRIFPFGILEIRDSQGEVLYRRHSPAPAVVAPPDDVARLAGMMNAVLTVGTGKAARLDRPAAAKTGTSSDYRDAWFMGFTADLVAGVWLGNDDNSEMKRVTGGSLPARLWHDVMVDAHTRRPPRALPGADIAPALDMPAPRPDILRGFIDSLGGTSRDYPDDIHRN